MASSSRARARARAPAQVVELPDHDEVLGAGEVLVHGRVLPGQADPSAKARRVADDVEPGDARLPAIGPQQRRQDPHGGRLAGAVRAQQAEHRSRLGAQVHGAEGEDVAVALAQLPGLDRRLAGHARHANAGARSGRRRHCQAVTSAKTVAQSLLTLTTVQSCSLARSSARSAPAV